MKTIYCIFLLISYLSLVQPNAPSEKVECKTEDSGIIAERIQLKVRALFEGIPELSIETLDPMFIDFARIDTTGLQMDLFQACIRGFKDAIIDKMNIDVLSRQIEIVYHTDFTMKSLYKADGTLLDLPFNGDGVAEVSAKNLKVNLFMPFEINKDVFGQDVVDLKGMRYSFDVMDDLKFNYSNLFYGNKDQSDEMHKFLHENWKVISKTYGGQFFDVVHVKMFDSFRRYFLSQPINVLLS